MTGHLGPVRLVGKLKSIVGVRLAFASGATVVALLAVWGASGSSYAVPAPVYAFPIPGSHTALPVSQITLRGVPVSQFGAISVAGSRSGVHAGTVEADSDGHGGSFLPAKPFAAGETVTVRTGLDIIGGSGGSYQFVVASPAGRIRPDAVRRLGGCEVTSSDSTPSPIWFR